MTAKVYLWANGKLDPKAVLEVAKEKEYKHLMVIGWSPSNELVIYGTSDNIPENYFLASHARDHFMDQSHGVNDDDYGDWA